MIPFLVPEENVIINLGNVVRIVDHPATPTGEHWCSVHMTDGKILTYKGQAADIVFGQCLFIATSSSPAWSRPIG